MLAYKVNSNGGNVGFGVGVVCEPKQQTRLSHTGVSDEEQFKEVVAGGEGKSEGKSQTTAMLANRARVCLASRTTTE